MLEYKKVTVRKKLDTETNAAWLGHLSGPSNNDTKSQCSYLRNIYWFTHWRETNAIVLNIVNVTVVISTTVTIFSLNNFPFVAQEMNKWNKQKEDSEETNQELRIAREQLQNTVSWQFGHQGPV